MDERSKAKVNSELVIIDRLILEDFNEIVAKKIA